MMSNRPASAGPAIGVKPARASSGGRGRFQGAAVRPGPLAHDASLRRSRREALAWIKGFVLHAPLTFAMFDGQMRYLLVSDQWNAALGRTGDELVGNHHYDVFPDVPADWKESHQRALRGEVVQDEEHKWVRADGSVAWLRREAQPWFLADGTIGGIIVLVQDVTSRKEAEIAQLESLDRLQAIIDQAASLIYVTDLRGDFTTVNQRLAEVLGHRPERIVGRNRRAFLPKETEETHRSNDVEVFQSGQARTWEETNLEWDGLHTYPSVKFPLRDRMGSITGVCGISHDITERKTAERRLEDSERRLAAAQERAKLGTIEVVPGTGEVLWSNEMYRLYERERSLGPPCRVEMLEYVHPEDRASLREALGAVECGMPRAPVVFRSNPQRLAEKWFEARCGVIRRGGHDVVVATIQDVTDRIQAELVLQDVHRRLLGAEDHERRRIARELHDSTVQDLLTVILSIDALRELPSLRQERAALNGIDDAVAVLERSVSELRTLAYSLHPRRLDEVGLLGAIRDYASGFRARTGIEVSLELPDLEPPMSDEWKLVLFRVLQECLTNIHRHADSPTATIRFALDERNIRLEIMDAGRRAFPEAPAAGHGVGPGGGIGIFSMRERLQHVGGRLEINTGPVGTTIRALVPRKPR